MPVALDLNTTLVVAAYAPELAGLTERGLRTRAIGIGLVAAAGGAARVLAELRPERVLLVGTAGALPESKLQIGQVVVAAGAVLGVRPLEYLPGPMAREATAEPALATALAARLGAPLVTVVSPLGVTADDDEAQRLSAAGQVEQLECFALFDAAARAGVAASAVLAIANQVGADAAAQWRLHRARAEAAACAALLLAAQPATPPT